MTGTEMAPEASAMEAMPGMDHSVPMTGTEPAPGAGAMDGMDHGASSGAHVMAPVPSAGVPAAMAAAGPPPSRTHGMATSRSSNSPRSRCAGRDGGRRGDCMDL
ncbi:MAG: hypothetical protein IPK16_26070 [Anaerolineales bacterium]|nr:hypothetical protein [Anaerolineales bacterium]